MQVNSFRQSLVAFSSPSSPGACACGSSLWPTVWQESSPKFSVESQLAGLLVSVLVGWAVPACGGRSPERACRGVFIPIRQASLMGSRPLGRPSGNPGALVYSGRKKLEPSVLPRCFSVSRDRQSRAPLPIAGRSSSGRTSTDDMVQSPLTAMGTVSCEWSPLMVVAVMVSL